MSISRTINSLLSLAGVQLVKESMLYEWQKAEGRISPQELILPEGAAPYLDTANPWLTELRSRYAAFQTRATEAIVWTDEYIQSYELASFRGDNCYVWQSGDKNSGEVNYALTAYYIKSIDRLGILQKIDEDGAFGVHTYSIDSRLVSRDLLDSVAEMYFLEDNLQLSSVQDLKILDIGAGYGRLASRFVPAFDNLAEYICTDAVPESTFISDYYVKHREIDDRAKVLPLDEIENYLGKNSVHLAVNIHSFSECSLPAIRWWLKLLAANKVPHLMVIPNANDHGGKRLELNNGEDFSGLIKECGYELVANTPKYSDPVVQRYGISPTYHFLFELTA